VRIDRRYLLTSDGERLVGQPARRQAVVNGEHTIFASKRYVYRHLIVLTKD